MEGRGGRLEGEACQEKHETKDQPNGRIGLGDYVKARASGETVDQRSPVKQQSRGERSKDEVLETCFRRPKIIAGEGGQNVGGQREGLDPHVERHKIIRREHDACPEGGEYGQQRKLVTLEARPPNARARHGQRHSGHGVGD